MLKQAAAAIGMLMTGLMAGNGLAQDGDPAAGEKVFRQCQVCHAFDAEQRRQGPHLVGIIGRPAGSVEGFTHPGHDPVPEDAEDAVEEARRLPVPFHVLVGQPGHDGLGHGRSGHVYLPLCPVLLERPG